MKDEGLTFPLATTLAAWFGHRLADIPEPLRSAIDKATMEPWDAMNASQRAHWAEQHDLQSDPALSPASRQEIQVAFERVWLLAELKAEYQRVLAMKPEQPSEHRIKRAELKRIEGEICDLQMPGATSESRREVHGTLRQTEPDRQDQRLRAILVKLEYDPAKIPRERGGNNKRITAKKRAREVALAPGGGFSKSTFESTWERLPKVGTAPPTSDPPSRKGN